MHQNPFRHELSSLFFEARYQNEIISPAAPGNNIDNRNISSMPPNNVNTHSNPENIGSFAVTLNFLGLKTAAISR
jgi:hypothetical protein